MNAVVLVEGWLEGGADGARAQLETFWRRVSLDGALSPRAARPLRPHPRLLERNHVWTDVLVAGRSAPTTPIRSTSTRCATRSPTSSISSACAPARGPALHHGHQCLDRQDRRLRRRRADAPITSWRRPACRRVFQAVEIDGRALLGRRLHGQSGPVPAVLRGASRTTSCSCRSTRSNAGRRRARRGEIQNRLNEITFNANLLRELRAVEFVTRLIDDGKLSPDEYKRVLMHRIDGSGVLDDYTASSRLNAEWDFFLRLRDAGRDAAQDVAEGQLRRDRHARHARSQDRSVSGRRSNRLTPPVGSARRWSVLISESSRERVTGTW